MVKDKCSECGMIKDVQPAKDYPPLEEMLTSWHVREKAANALVCPECAAAICGCNADEPPADLNMLR